MKLSSVMKLSSGQSGVDSLLSSGWVVIVGVCAIIVLSQMGAFRSAPCSKNSFWFFTGRSHGLGGLSGK